MPDRYSYHMIKESGCFVVNLASKKNRELFDYLGSHSRRDGDKLSEAGAALEECSVINAPILADCPVSIECSVAGSIKTGSHEMFVGKIEKVHADVNVMNEEGNVDFSKLDLL